MTDNRADEALREVLEATASTGGKDFLAACLSPSHEPNQ